MANKGKNSGSIASQKKTAAEVSEEQLQKQLEEKIKEREKKGLEGLLKFLEDNKIELHITPDITINGQSPAIAVRAKQ